jgi:thiol-disulfide isomerase/thioredoxin
MSPRLSPWARAAVAVAGLASGCATTGLREQVSQLEQRVALLEAQVRGVARPGTPGAAPGTNADDAAIALYEQAVDLAMKGMAAEARTLAQEILANYASTRAAAPAQRMLAELAVVGREVSDLGVDTWYQSQATLADHPLTLLIFFEVWCPHCQREMPRLQATFDNWRDQGLGVVGVTSLSRGKTAEEVVAFAQSASITYPIGHAAPGTWEAYGVNGVPAAALVRDGVVVWRGHPALLEDDDLRGWLSR